MTSDDSILVVGAGFVGLSTAAFLAGKGRRVTVVEKNRLVVDSLNRGKLHFHEPTLAREIGKVLKSGRLQITAPSKESYQRSSMIFVAIDSADQRTRKMRLAAFERMAQWIGGVKRERPALVVLKSTNILGFAELFRVLLDAAPYGSSVRLAVNPEFLREGLAYEDTAKPWRIIVGTQDTPTRTRMVRFFRSIYGSAVPLVATDWKSAELIKLSSNLYLAHRLTFINEIAEYARPEGLDIDAIRKGIGLDPRIGQDYFEPGLGFGGSCLPKDCHLINSSEVGGEFWFLTAQTALAVNDRILDSVVDALQSQLGKLKGRKIALLGAAFKPQTDDTRGSRAVELAVRLMRLGVRVSVYEPFLKSAERIVEGNLPLEHNLEATVSDASAIVVGTAHRRFRSLKPESIARLVKKRLVVDRPAALARRRWEKHGFQFI